MRRIAREVVEHGLTEDHITEEMISSHISTAGIPILIF